MSAASVEPVESSWTNQDTGSNEHDRAEIALTCETEEYGQETMTGVQETAASRNASTVTAVVTAVAAAIHDETYGWRPCSMVALGNQYQQY